MVKIKILQGDMWLGDIHVNRVAVLSGENQGRVGYLSTTGFQDYGDVGEVVNIPASWILLNKQGWALGKPKAVFGGWPGESARHSRAAHKGHLKRLGY